jgi:hypothetical protein
MRAFIIATAGLLCAACAGANSVDWQRQNSTLVQIEQDLKECKYEAEKYTPDTRGDPIVTGVNDGLRNVKLRDQCMEVRGYSKR